MLDNLQVQVSMMVDCSLPIIYYGARTHKQLEQVVQEFSKTVYAENALMTILSSREHSCIKDFDIKRWPSKNDMCRGCTKVCYEPRTKESQAIISYEESSGKNYFRTRTAATAKQAAFTTTITNYSSTVHCHEHSVSRLCFLWVERKRHARTTLQEKWLQ